MEQFTTDEWEIIGEIQQRLDESDIVWPKYGNTTTLDLAIRIFKDIRSKMK